MCNFPSADNSNRFAALGMGHDQNPFGARYSDRDEPLLREGVIRVWIRQRQGVAINCGGLLERHPVLAAVASGFGRVPFKNHALSLLHFLAAVGK